MVKAAGTKTNDTTPDVLASIKWVNQYIFISHMYLHFVRDLLCSATENSRKGEIRRNQIKNQGKEEKNEEEEDRSIW